MITREIEVHPTVAELAAEFAGLSSEDQVDFLIAVRRHFDSWEPHSRDMQFLWIGEQMRAAGPFVCDFVTRLAESALPISDDGATSNSTPKGRRSPESPRRASGCSGNRGEPATIRRPGEEDVSHYPRDTINEAAYRAYCAAVQTRGHTPLRWDELSAKRRRSWRAAARAVLGFKDALQATSEGSEK